VKWKDQLGYLVRFWNFTCHTSRKHHDQLKDWQLLKDLFLGIRLSYKCRYNSPTKINIYFLSARIDEQEWIWRKEGWMGEIKGMIWGTSFWPISERNGHFPRNRGKWKRRYERNDDDDDDDGGDYDDLKFSCRDWIKPQKIFSEFIRCAV